MFRNARSPDERLSIWRKYRQNLHGYTELDAVRVFSDIPIESRYIDYYTPDSWPTSFEIVQNGLFCQSGITLVMAATLDYLGFVNSKQIHLPVISNYITGAEGLVLEKDNLYYNFIPGKIVDYEFVKENSNLYEDHIIAIDKLYH
jgi:hypothetical protein